MSAVCGAILWQVEAWEERSHRLGKERGEGDAESMSEQSLSPTSHIMGEVARSRHNTHPHRFWTNFMSVQESSYRVYII